MFQPIMPSASAAARPRSYLAYSPARHSRSQVPSHERVGALDLVRHRFADVVQEGCTARGLRTGAELVGHQHSKSRYLDRVRQHVLAVAGAELEPAQELDQLGVKSLDAGLE